MEFTWSAASAILFTIFIWSGFVRTGLGFGGALLSMPFILLIDNRPLVYLPIIALHLLIFSPIALFKNRRIHALNHPNTESAGLFALVDWPYLKKTFPILLGPKLLGVLGLVNLPAAILSPIIYSIVSVYALSYLFDKPIRSKHAWMDYPLLMLGAYISGTSLIGGPLIMAVFMTHVAKEKLRDTLFVLWFVLVSIKMVSFLLLGVSLQWQAHLWLLPAAAIGHVIGDKFHGYLVKADTKVFYRVIGASLLLASLLGIAKQILGT